MKIKSLIYVALFLFPFNTLYCVDIDTLVFDNEMEKKNILQYVQSKPVDPLYLFLSIEFDDKEEVERVSAEFTLFLMQVYVKIENKSIKKQVKRVNKYIHENFLKSYKRKAKFSEIFTEGKYNCLTATELHALVFEYFDIEYSIREKPEHIYLIADPNGKNIYVETTLPSKGLYAFKDKFQREYIEYLYKKDIISSIDLKSNSHNSLFNKHFYPDKSINIYQLAGLQYSNLGLFSMQVEQYYEAMKFFEKACLLYETEKIFFLINTSIMNYLYSKKKEKEYHPELLAKYVNYNREDRENMKFVEDYYDNMSHELTINSPEIEKYEHFNESFLDNLKDTTIKQAYVYDYNFYSAYYYYMNSEYSKALNHLEYSYNINNENLKIKQMILDGISRHLFNNNNFDATLDSLKHYFNIFHFIEHDKVVQRYYIYSLMRLMGNHYKNDEFTQGEKYLNMFEQFVSKHKIKDFDTDIIAFGFGELSAYYIRIVNYEKAEKYIHRGLELVPENQYLLNKLETLKEFIND
jgi:hypothetical protein